MATIAEIAEVRRLTNEPTPSETWTDLVLSTLIDAEGVRKTAAMVWEGKAASIAHLVDISEGGSSRKMSDLHKNWLALADRFRSDDGIESPTGYYPPRTRRGERA